MDIEKYGFERTDLLVVTAVNAYLKKLKPEVKRETLSEIVKKDGVIDGPALTALIESAKTAAMISLDGNEYMKNPPKEFLRFIEDWAK